MKAITPYNWVIFTLTQPQVTNQQKKNTTPNTSKSFQKHFLKSRRQATALRPSPPGRRYMSRGTHVYRRAFRASLAYRHTPGSCCSTRSRSREGKHISHRIDRTYRENCKMGILVF